MIFSSAKVLAEMLHTQNIPKFRKSQMSNFPTVFFVHINRRLPQFRTPSNRQGHLHIFTAVRSEPCISQPQRPPWVSTDGRQWHGRQWHGGVARDLRPKFALVRNGAGHLSIGVIVQYQCVLVLFSIDDISVYQNSKVLVLYSLYSISVGRPLWGTQFRTRPSQDAARMFLRTNHVIRIQFNDLTATSLNNG